MPLSESISLANSTVSSTTSDGPPPERTSTDSSTSSELPIFLPKGVDMSVSSADVLTPASFPSCTNTVANSFARSRVFMNAPEPTFTSRTNEEVPSAIFLLMIEDAIRGIASTVPVTSRKE